MKLALAQINPTVGDFPGNLQKILATAEKAAQAGARLTIFSELALCGYWPADLLEKPSFLARCQQFLDQLRGASAHLETAILIGVALPAPEGSGKRAVNAAVLLDKGKVVFEQHKMLLPFYDVFDEQRYFEPARSQQVLDFEGERLAITICEDAWNDKDFWPSRYYPVDPVEELVRQKPTLLINISASPFWHGKIPVRQHMLAAIAERHKLPVLICNQVGGNDSLIFDGSSFAVAPDGTLIAQAKSFVEDLVLIDTEASIAGSPIVESTPAAETEAAWNALVLGTRDYVHKTGFRKALIALSGGIDSALVGALAVEALGKENVLGIGMPSQYSSTGSIDDARDLAHNLGIRFELMAIEPLYRQFTSTLEPLFAGCKPDLTEENIQSRTRGVLMMALSNKFGALVLTTGNKSEMAVGYCTLYGDMVGALAVIGDLVKTRVYALSRYANRNGAIIPENTITKPPSAELRPDQKDTDSLPPYDVLDPILEAYVERYESTTQIAQTYGFSSEIIDKVVRLVERSEYKRQQAAPVLKVTPKSFGMGRRFPIAARAEG
ncbi:MAG TPA: NAD+ synthase [Acidobacteriaceae bacterium]|nr:NAD+ synthase [Acidobacteriaceae bacterium]